MATAMVMQLRRNAGFMFRETGQAMERLGMSMMGDYSYMEPREFCACRRSHFAPAPAHLSLPSRVPPRAHGPQSPTRALAGAWEVYLEITVVVNGWPARSASARGALA